MGCKEYKQKEIIELERIALELREVVLDMVKNANAGHIGGDFSVMDMLVALYFKHMNISPKNMEDANRDLFVLSKGHSVEAYYAVLAEKGFFSKEKVLEEFSTFGSQFIGHPNNELPGIEMNSGSLGHGLPVCVGMALAACMDGRKSRVYTIMGDGELAEGSVWEGFMAAGHYGLSNLCVLIDRNHLQISGPTEQVMTHENLHQQVESFGFRVLEVKGNSMQELDEALEEAKREKGKPTCIIANTIKGFGGGDVMENRINWHHKVPNEEEYQQIKLELQKRKEALTRE